MSSIRMRSRKDGTEYYAVLYRLDGKQSSLSFDDHLTASRFCDQANKFGVQNALATLKDADLTSQTVEQWITHYVDHLTGIEPETVKKYRAYLRNDIGPFLGDIPLAALSSDHVKLWLKDMNEPDEDGWQASAKTIRNKHGLLSAALNAAVPKHITANPCNGIRLPRWTRPETLFLNREQYDRLLSAVTEPWRPLVEFLVASGCRWGEATALRPKDVNRDAGTVNIVRAWKSGAGCYRLGPPKTPKSTRMINLPASVLDKLDYSHAFLFINRAGGPVRSHGFIRRVWAPAVNRAWPSVDEHGQPISDPAIEVLRPRIHDLRHTASSWLIQRGVLLPVISDHLGHESIQTTVDLYGNARELHQTGASSQVAC